MRKEQIVRAIYKAECQFYVYSDPSRTELGKRMDLYIRTNQLEMELAFGRRAAK